MSGFTIFGYSIIGVYIIALTYITVFCLMQLHLLFQYRRQKSKPSSELLKDDEEWPMVTVQLPIFNELYVTERLIDKIIEFDYPKDKLEIQILDDSTDETVDISMRKVKEYTEQGYDIKCVHRLDRTGFKAGALKEGTLSAKGEFIAIFDADFLPKADFLKSTIPQFQDSKIGVVQTRWEHLNENYSIITRLQAFQLNVHFTVEQNGRYLSDYLLQFNGTAGVWRKETITDSGGWEADTLTEDLDLSYRAQMNGWKIAYLEKIGSPAELPAEMNGLKSQQFRWMKGGAETAKKLLPGIWKSELSLDKKLHASSHLMASIVFLFVFFVGVVSVPVMLILHALAIDTLLLSVFFLGLLSIALVYFEANVRQSFRGDSWLKSIFKFIFIFPVFLSLSMGLSLHNSIAILQGLRGKKSPFVRTPKFNIKNIKDTFLNKNYIETKLGWGTIFEGLLSIYFLLAVLWGIHIEQTTFLIYHVLLMIGFGTIFFYSVRHLRFK